jgi:hypothetical protein
VKDALCSTAIHEAGHAVALCRLSGELNGRINALSIQGDGEEMFDVVELYEFTPETRRSEAIVYYSDSA